MINTKPLLCKTKGVIEGQGDFTWMEKYEEAILSRLFQVGKCYSK